jgi:hypothetical protein
MLENEEKQRLVGLTTIVIVFHIGEFSLTIEYKIKRGRVVSSRLYLK